MRDHDGAILVMLDGNTEELVPIVYVHRRLSARAARGVTCEGCGYTYSTREPYDERRPMYESFAAHDIDGFGDWLNWCQDCMDATADGKVNGAWNVSHWYTGRYGNSPALEIDGRPKHRRDKI